MIGNKTVVYTSGTFDMLHVNHLKMLEYARSLGDILIVGVNTDELVESYKNKRPIVPLEERADKHVLDTRGIWPDQPPARAPRPLQMAG